MSHNYLFDIKFFATVRIDANSAEEAEQKLRNDLGGATANAGAQGNGEPYIFELAIDNEDMDLIEVDGEPA